MKVMTVLGTRPEIIRLSVIIGKLDRAVDHVLVHTGQNFTATLSDIFFEEMGVRSPDHSLGVQADTFGTQIGRILAESDRVLRLERPDALLVLGDTNSGLVSIIAKRMGIPVFHLEAGNRCYDDRVPEEINRRVIDHSSTVLLPYTQRSKDNLVREGIARERIFVVGNPIFEVLQTHAAAIDRSQVLQRLELTRSAYFLATMHRAENVDVPERLRALLMALDALGAEHQRPVICSLHPRTRSRLREFGLAELAERIHFIEPLGFFDFVALERHAACVLSDSGTVQEECCIFGIPNVTIRDVTERPETLEAGSNILSGVEPERVLRCVRTALAEPATWQPPDEYMDPAVSSKVLKLLLGYFPAAASA